METITVKHGESRGATRYLLSYEKQKCVYCEATDCELTMEHIVPKSKGGKWEINNIVLACERCNHLRGNLDYVDFIALLNDLRSKCRYWAKYKIQKVRQLTAIHARGKYNLSRKIKEAKYWIRVQRSMHSRYSRMISNILRP